MSGAALVEDQVLVRRVCMLHQCCFGDGVPVVGLVNYFRDVGVFESSVRPPGGVFEITQGPVPIPLHSHAKRLARRALVV